MWPRWRLASRVRFVKRTLLSISLLVLLPGLACIKTSADKEAANTQSTEPQVGDTLPPVEQQLPRLEGGTLRVAMGAEPPSLNFQLDPLDAWGKTLHELTYNNLARPNPRTWEHEPMLAERWDITNNGLTFTFHLRKGVTWHDGKPFTARDVTFTFEKLLDPTSKTVSMRTFLEPIEKVHQLDDHTVRFTMKRPYWLAFDAIAEIYIYPEHVFGQGNFNHHPANRAPVGTGPFKFVHWKTGDEIVYVRNPHYFGAAPKLDKLVFKYTPDPAVRLQLAKAGQLDLVFRVSPQAWEPLMQDAALGEKFWRLRHVPSGLQWVGWNTQRPYFADARVRRALTMLLDRQDIVDNLRHGLDAPAASWFYPGSKEHNAALKPLPYDPQQAAQLLEAAGWKDTDGDGVRDKEGVRFEFTFLYPAGSPFYEQLAGMMRNAYQPAGIALKTQRLEWAVFTERLRQHQFDACSLLWQIQPRHDPYQIWHSSEAQGGSNFISYNNPQVDQLLVSARKEFNETKRVQMYHRLTEILYNEQPYTLLFHRYNLSLVSKRVGGVYSTPYGIFRFEDLYLREKAPPADPAHEAGEAARAGGDAKAAGSAKAAEAASAPEAAAAPAEHVDAAK